MPWATYRRLHGARTSISTRSKVRPGRSVVTSGQGSGQVVPPRGGRPQGDAEGQADQVGALAGLDQPEAFLAPLDLEPLGNRSACSSPHSYGG